MVKQYVYQHSFFVGWLMFFMGVALGSYIQDLVLKSILHIPLILGGTLGIIYTLLMNNKNIRWDDDEDD